MIFHAVDLELLAKINVAKCNRRRIRKRLRETIEFAKETSRPDRQEWCEVLLKKFAPQEAQNAK
jgi:hydrogenase maturation factor HypE